MIKQRILMSCLVFFSAHVFADNLSDYEGFLINNKVKAKIHWDKSLKRHQNFNKIQKAFKHGVEQILAPIEVDSPILIMTSFMKNTHRRGLAISWPREFKHYHTGERVVNIPLALERQISKSGPTTKEGIHCDLFIVINEDKYDEGIFWLGTDPEMPAGLDQQVSLAEVIAHELCHGLGFYSLLQITGNYSEKNFPSTHDATMILYDTLNTYITSLNCAERLTAGKWGWFSHNGFNLVSLMLNAPMTDRLSNIYAPYGNLRLQELQEVQISKDGKIETIFINSSHFHDIYSNYLLMGPRGLRGGTIGDARPEHCALADIGWQLKGTHMSKCRDFYKVSPSTQKTTTTFERSLTLTNYDDTETTIEAVKIFSGRPDAFSLAPLSSTTLPPKRSQALSFYFSPTEPYGFYSAHLVVWYRDAENSRRSTAVYLQYYASGEDSDADGISDHEESRDLDLTTPEIDTPFGPGADLIGDDFTIGADGIPDGENDWDGDGDSNAYEFEHGGNPLFPDASPGDGQIDDGYSELVTVSNAAPFPLTLDTLSIEGEDALDFMLTSQNYVSRLEPDQEMKIPIAFTPQDLGKKEATLKITFQVGGQAIVKEVPLSGEGAAPTQ